MSLQIVMVTTGRPLHKETLARLDTSGSHAAVQVLAEPCNDVRVGTPEQDLTWRNYVALRGAAGPVLVLEDDLFFCDGFGALVERIAPAAEEAGIVLSLFVPAKARRKMGQPKDGPWLDYPAARFVGTQALLWSTAAAWAILPWLECVVLPSRSLALDTALRSLFEVLPVLRATSEDWVDHDQHESLMPTSHGPLRAGRFKDGQCSSR